MNSESDLKKVEDIFKKILKKTTSHNKDFFEIGGNSFLAIQLLYEIKNTFELELELKDLLIRPLSINYLLRLIKAKNKKNYSRISTVSAKVQANKFKAPVFKLKHENDQKVKKVLLTGATGFIGSHLLSSIHKNSRCQIYCLVRSKSKARAVKKIKESLSFYKLTSGIDLSRIKVCVGDLSLKKFGLSHSEYLSLAKTIDTVIHAGANVNFELSYNDLSQENVTATQEVIKFASFLKPKSLHYISSIAVLGINHKKKYTGIKFLENKNSNTLPKTTGYAQTKYIAEKNIQTAISAGLNANIYRLGEVAPSTKTGVPNNKSLFHIFIKALIELGIYPRIYTRYDYIPVDFVCDFITKVILNHGNRSSKTYHICHPKGISLPELMGALNSFHLRSKAIEPSKFLKKLRTFSNEKLSVSIATLIHFSGEVHNLTRGHNANIFDQTFLKEMKNISMLNTKKDAKKIGVRFPELNRMVFKQYATFIKEN